MKTIIVTSQKGGSGKTTLCAHLSVEAERCGDGPTWIIDTDKQGTLSEWHDRRGAPAPQRADIPHGQLQDALKAIAGRGGEWVFVDTPPTATEQNATLMGLADLVLIPVRPSPADLWAVSATIEMAQDARRPFLFVISQAKANASITAQTVAALSHYGPVAATFVADRVTYASAMTDGRSAAEFGARASSAKEIAGLWSDVKTTLATQTTKRARRKS
jgi:chromosome partitioning protein